MTFRPGDEIEIKVKIIDDGGPSGDLALIEATDDGRNVVSFSMPKRVLAAGKRIPRPIGVGDRVIHRAINAPPATVIAIHKDRAWVAFDDDTDGHYPLSDLTPDDEG